MNFAELGLNEAVLRALTDAGYVHPTAVQREAIPAALAGHDLLVSSHTGSGKTAAFLLPALVRLGSPATAQGRGPRVLVLTPTRELALQVEKAPRTYGRHLPALRTAALVGGVPYQAAEKSLAGTPDGGYDLKASQHEDEEDDERQPRLSGDDVQLHQS
jgi:superfamily II DNA/RNA helicase